MYRHLIKMDTRLFAFLVLLLVVSCDSADPGRTSSLTETRIERLSRGINTSHWFAQTDLTPARFTSYIKASDIRMIREMGFTHIRLSLDPAALFDEENPAALDVVNRHHLDNALNMILEERLGVIIDPHPESAFKHRMRDDPEFFEKAKTYWGALAAHMNSRDPEYVFLEVMNEPEYENAAHWESAQSELLAVMREAAPDHTLIATGPRWSGVDELVRITPVDDPNVVYNFHMYDPHNFTHQGATWGWEGWRDLRGLPYPSSPEALEPVLPTLPAGAQNTARQYGQERWNRERMEAHLAGVIEWAEEHGVRLTCNEFGVYRSYAPAESRKAWLSDLRSILEENEIGWTMWDYAGGFSVVNSEAGVRTPDPATLEALGLP